MFNYFGSKQRLAKTYQPPRHDVIVEPFAGAGAYTVAWLVERPSLRAVLVDRDEKVVELWHRLLSMTPADIMAIECPPVGERTTDMMVALSAAAPGVVGSFNRTGDAQVTEWQARDWPKVRLKVAATRARIGSSERVEVIHGDYNDAPPMEATWFVDPPYQHQGHLYYHGSEDIDFGQLADWCKNLPGQVIVTEAHPADWLPFEPHRSHVAINGSRNTELVWYSDPDPSLFDV